MSGMVGAVASGGGVGVPVPRASTEITWADRLGALRMRLNLGRNNYKVEPGLYRVGEPTAQSPVLVTSNYKYTFDVVRSKLVGLDAWLLVLDTKGVNVWCAAGKQTFSTMELCRKVIETGLSDLVEHRTLVLPQLGASGIAAHDVRSFTGFRVVYGPVRADDIKEFLDAGMKATPEMRRVKFDVKARFMLTGVELSYIWRPKILVVMAALFVSGGLGIWGFNTVALVLRGSAIVLAGLLGVIAGGFFTMLLLPWLPYRAFAAKGVLVGAVFGALLAWAYWDLIGVLAAPAVAVGTTVVASYVAMNCTGASAITSPSGVEREMRRWLPWQIGGAALAVVLWIASMVI